MNAIVSDSPAPRCLVVDDEPAICQTIRYALDTEGWSVSTCGDIASSRKLASSEPFDLALVDLRLGRRSGLELLPFLKAEQPGIPVVIITAYASVPSAVDAMQRGATSYLPKPFNPLELRKAVAKAMATRSNQARDKVLPRPVLDSRAAPMQALLVKIRKVAQSGGTTLLLQGETGTGKGVMARAVHDLSPRKDGPFVVVPCPALPPDMLESELFGHVRGAFTGAERDHPGRLARAEGGTLFLDEVGDLPLSLQTKLLRVLQEREYERLGDSQTIKADVRIISATNVNLSDAVRFGRFRQDLYYRLSAVELRVPPLRERREDLPKLIDSMLEELRYEMGRGPKGFSPQAIARLQSYDWPGNLRELRNVLERVCVLSNQDMVPLEDLAGMYAAQPRPKHTKPEESEPLVTMGQIEAAHIRKVLSQTKTLEQAAKILDMTAVTLWRKRKKYGL
jgi:two-component system, NtrC family, response regulator AlgB